MNNFWLVLAIFLGFQVVIIGLIVFFLRRSLLAGLQEEAVHQFEVLYGKELPADLGEIEIVTRGGLSQAFRDRIELSVSRKLSRPIPIRVIKDPLFKGGLIIRAGTKVIDGSLVSKLEEGGILKGQSQKGQA